MDKIKWEYMIKTKLTNDHLHSVELLNEMGQECFELVFGFEYITVHGDKATRFFFKRPIEDEKDVD